jgi:hypothetical protein
MKLNKTKSKESDTEEFTPLIITREKPQPKKYACRTLQAGTVFEFEENLYLIMSNKDGHNSGVEFPVFCLSTCTVNYISSDALVRPVKSAELTINY